VPGDLCVSNLKRQKEGKAFFDEEGVKVFISKNYWKNWTKPKILTGYSAAITKTGRQSSL